MTAKDKISLRQKTEKRLRKKYAYLHNKTLNKTQAAKELWVHQVDLEMQNEELKRVQMELEQSRQKYADLYDFAPTGYFVINKKNVIKEANLTVQTLVGIEKQNLIGASFIDCIASESHEQYYLFHREVFEKGVCSRCQLKMIRKHDGGHFYAEVIFDPIFVDNRVDACRLAVIDITQRKIMEDELRRSRHELEQRVKEKTADLIELVKILRTEIDQKKQAEIALKKQTRDIDAFFSASITPLVFLDKDFNFIRVNEAYARECGRTVSEFAGRNHFELYPNEENKQIFEQVVRTKKPYQAAAKPFVFPDHPEWGVTYWDWVLVPILDNTGKVEFLAFSLKNVTENIRAQKALEESEKKYRTLVELSPDAICVIANDKIVFANDTANKIVKAQKNQFIGQSLWQFIAPDSLSIMKEKIQNLYNGTTNIESAEITLVRTDGSKFQAGGTAALIDYEGTKAVLIEFRDISIQKKQEESLKRLKYRLSEAQRIAHLGNWEWDIQNNTVWLSDESYKILGIDKDRFDGNFETLCSCIHQDDKQKVKQVYENAVKECKPYNVEFRIILPDGNQRFIHKRAEVTCLNNKAIRVVGTIQDVTEQKKTENQIILSRQKLRTLAAKMEMIEEQERRRIASDLHDSVGQILAFATRELKFIHKSLPKKHSEAIMEVARQLDKAVEQTRTLSFDLSPSILYDIGFEVAIEDMVEKFTAQRKINCQFIDDGKNKPMTIPIKILLYRSIRELLMNIAKHADARNAKVSLKKTDKFIQATVEDDGKGFDVAEIESSEKQKGFGLFHIKDRIEHMGGSLKIESQKGKGTKTTLTAPLSGI